MDRKNIAVTADDDGANVSGGDGSAAVGPGAQADDFGGQAPGGGRGGGPGGESDDGSTLVISGGQLVIDSEGDGLDSNGSATMSGGTVVVSGPSSQGNGAIDVNGTFALSGGTLLAVGSAGMLETPDASAEQAWIAATFQSGHPAGTVFAIEANRTVLATFTASKAIESIVFSSADLVAGSSYDLYSGASAEGEDVGGLTTAGSTSGATLLGSITAAGG